MAFWQTIYLFLGGDNADALNDQITEQGNKVRDLKSKKAEKADIDAAVKVLLELKAKYKAETGQDWKPAQDNAKRAEKPKKEPKKQQEKQPKKEQESKGQQGQKVTRLGMEAKKEESLADWYSQIITKAELLEYLNVKSIKTF